MSEDYHDYVIRGGRLVGAWDEMYAACVDPWHQSQAARSDGRMAVLRYARQVSARSLVEIGCGLGFLTAELARQGFRVTGVDISPVAIERARELHPEIASRFRVGRADTDLGDFVGVDALVFSEVTWYILDSLDSALDGLRRHHAGRYLIHLLTFYGPGRQRYGREHFTTPDELVARFGLEVVDMTYADWRTDGDYACTILFRIPA